MITEEQRIDPGHGRTRTMVRGVGLAMTAVGAVLIVMGILRLSKPIAVATVDGEPAPAAEKPAVPAEGPAPAAKAPRTMEEWAQKLTEDAEARMALEAKASRERSKSQLERDVEKSHEEFKADFKKARESSERHARQMEREMAEDDAKDKRLESALPLILPGAGLALVGLSITAYGFMGKMARYAAAEMAPVGKDTFNYVAGGTKEGVREVATALSAGIAQGLGHPEAPAAACPHCGHANEAGGNFCAKCGQPMALACPACGAKVEANARFCVNCGRQLG